MPTQTPEQRAAAFQGAGLNYAQQGAATQGVQLSPTFSPITAPLPTMDASKLAGNTTASSFVFPSPPPDAGTTATTANNLNSSIPTADSIVAESTVQTPGEAKNQGLLQKLATAIGSKTSLATLKTEAENAIGAPNLAKTLNDLNSQLEGLTNQSLALQNDAGNYGAIQNKQRLNESGGNVEAAMHGRPLTKDALLQNQIQQSAIASQALTLKSAIYAANGSLALAKDAADKAAQAQFDKEEQDIKYQEALINANLPQMNKEEKAQAALLTAKLADRQTQIENAKEDKKTAIALAAAAMKNNPSDPAAQYAAQQALAESNKPQPDLEKIFALVGKYQNDPLDIQQKILQLQATRANIAQSYAATAASRASAAKTLSETGGATNSSSAFINQPGYAKLTAKQRTQADSLNNLVRSISDYKTSLDENTGFTGANLTGSDAALLQTKLNSIIFAAAQAEGTGALQQADREVIEKIIPNPTSVGGAFNAARTGGKAGQILKLDDQIQKYTDNLAGYGLTPVDPSPTTSDDTQVVKGVTYKKAADGLYYPQ